LFVSEQRTPPAWSVKNSGNEGVCPLSKVRAGTAVRIKELAAAPELCQRLREMGFGEEQRIRCLLKNSNVVCQVCNVRLGISAKLADHIWVEPLAPHQRAA